MFTVRPWQAPRHKRPPCSWYAQRALASSYIGNGPSADYRNKGILFSTRRRLGPRGASAATGCRGQMAARRGAYNKSGPFTRPPGRADNQEKKGSSWRKAKMRGNRRSKGARIASRMVKARAKPRRSGSPRRGSWRSEAQCDTLNGRLRLFDDEGVAGNSSESREPGDT